MNGSVIIVVLTEIKEMPLFNILYLLLVVKTMCIKMASGVCECDERDANVITGEMLEILFMVWGKKP